ncbi:MAG: hypothetical protein Q8M88_17570 [Phenylobacterium sp.]|uniref:hypothetical protein n=1 Tax=Phenylobacterium sp. TaxID=1871053 RepID=UPI0027345837|nr:hypothetical protein [Phenylobacterium sp.]MDP3176236.1 hypothetical protein [Phenylobacterium sp.]
MAGHDAYSSNARGSAGSDVIFLWLVWALTAAWFFPFAARTLVGIMSVTPPPGGAGAASAGMMAVGLVVFVVLVVAAAYAVASRHRRDRALESASEAVTKAQYDAPHAAAST